LFLDGEAYSGKGLKFDLESNITDKTKDKRKKFQFKTNYVDLELCDENEAIKMYYD